MTVPHERLREWIISKLDQKNVFGLEWKDKKEMTFKVIWLHQRNSEWRDEYGQVFLEWAQHTGKYVPGRDETNYTQWKTTLRNALHKCEEFKELHKSPPKVKPYPFKVYKILERKKKTPARPSPGPEQERFEPVSDNSQHLPAVVDEMSSLESSNLASPAQQVPGTLEGFDMSNISNQPGNNTTCSNSSTGSSLGQIDPSQEIDMTSSEFRDLLDQFHETDPSTTPTSALVSSASMSRTTPDSLQKPVANTIILEHQHSSTLANATQQVQGTIEGAAISHISNPSGTNTTLGLCGSDSVTVSSMGQVDPSQEIVSASSKFQNLLDQVPAIDPPTPTTSAALSSARMPGANTDVLQQAIDNTILSEHQDHISSEATDDLDLEAYLTSDSQTITDPLLGQQEINMDWLNKDPSLSMEISLGSDVNFDHVKNVASANQAQSETSHVQRDQSLQPAVPSVSGPHDRALIPKSNDATDDTAKSTCNEDTLSDLFTEANNGGLNVINTVGIDHSLGTMCQPNPGSSGAAQVVVEGKDEALGTLNQNQQGVKSSKVLVPESVTEVKKYSYPVVPEQMCDHSCNLFLELLYQGHLVKEWRISNPSGCRIHSQVNPFTVDVGKANCIDVKALYGAENKDQCELIPWPVEIKIKSPDKIPKLWQGLRRGLVIESQEGSIFVTRLCKTELYYSPAFVHGDPNQQFAEITRTKVDNIHQPIKVFDYEKSFVPALYKYRLGGEQGGPKPNTGVYICIGQQSVNMSRLLLVVRVTSCRALRELHQAEKEKEEESLSLRMEPPDSFDKIDSLLQQISNTLTIEEK